MRIRSLLIALLAVPRFADAQVAALTANLGAVYYHFGRSGVVPMLTMRFAYDLTPTMRIEPSIGYMIGSSIENLYDPITGQPYLHTTSRATFPEVSLTFHPDRDRWAPFASVGLGASIQQPGVVPRSVTVVSRAGIHHRFGDAVGLTLGGQFRSLSTYGYTVDLSAGLMVFGTPFSESSRQRRRLFQPSRSPQRFAVATGLALPTRDAFGLFPTVRAEWYVTDPDRRVALLADGHVSRAFANPGIGPDPLDHRGEYGFALSVVPQLIPRATLTPYVVWGLRWRKPWAGAPNQYNYGTIPVQYRRAVPDDLRVAQEYSRIEPNVAGGFKLRMPSGQDLRLEIHYYMGLNYFPVTLGLSF